MTLDEAIEHCLEQARKQGKCPCAEEHYRLALWLIELRERRKQDKIN